LHLFGIENLSLHKNLRIDVYNNFIHNCQNLQATKKYFTRGMIKKWYVHAENLLHKLKEMGHQTTKKTWRNGKHILLNERSQSEMTTST